MRKLSLVALTLCLGTLDTQAATLRPMTTLHSSIVKLSDLFDDAGTNANKALGPGPGVGGRIVVESAQLAAIAHQFRVDWRPASSADRAVLDRPGRPLRRDAVMRARQERLETSGASADCDIDLAEFTAADGAAWSPIHGPLFPISRMTPAPAVSPRCYRSPATGWTRSTCGLLAASMTRSNCRSPPAGCLREPCCAPRTSTWRASAPPWCMARWCGGQTTPWACSCGISCRRPAVRCRGTDPASDRAEGRHRPDAARQSRHRAHRARPGAGGRFDRRTHPGAQSDVARRDRGRSDGP